MEPLRLDGIDVFDGELTVDTVGEQVSIEMAHDHTCGCYTGVLTFSSYLSKEKAIQLRDWLSRWIGEGPKGETP